MRRLETKLDGPILFEPTTHGDERGFFAETYRRTAFAELGVPEEMVQDNHSRSSRGIVRGMHFQIGAGAAKLVRCARGAIYDVVVDLRKGSPTFGQWEGFELTEENMHMAYCPVGFAHGFCVLSDVADVMYKQSNYYADETERGISFRDPDVAIEWPLPADELIPSQRDLDAPRLSEIHDELPFTYEANPAADQVVRELGVPAPHRRPAPRRWSSTPLRGRSMPPGPVVVSTGSSGTSSPAPSRIACVNSNHEHAPSATRCTTPSASPSTAARIASARSAVKVGWSRWSATMRSASPFRARPIMRSTKLPPFDALPASPYRPAVRTTSAPGA